MKLIALWKFILIILFLFVAFNKKSFASVVCAPNYGGGETCIETKIEKLSLEKDVSFKESGEFKNRIKDAGAGETVYFRITVKNEGDTNFEKLTVEDDLPKYLKTKEDTEWTIRNLAPGKEWSETFKAEVVDGGDLPDNDICVVNEARVKESNKIAEEDTAVVCIEAFTKVLGVKELPVTGGRNIITGKEISFAVMSLGLFLLGIGLKKFI